MGERDDPLAEAFDGASQDWLVSSDAMRWSPDRGNRDDPRTLFGVDVPARIGSVLHVDPAVVRRLLSRAVEPFAEVAADMLDELRGRTRPAVPPASGRRTAVRDAADPDDGDGDGDGHS